MTGRVGVVTNKRLKELTHENYSKRAAVLASVPMTLLDIISYIVEKYIDTAVGFEILGVSLEISVPLVFIAHISIVYGKKYA
jgi:manganese transport protein